MIRLATLVLIASVYPVSCAAQQSTGFASLEGTVTDSSHLPVPDASVEVLNPSTSHRREAVTDANGDFRVVGLPIATYEVLVNARGFATYKHTGIDLAMGQTVRLAVTLVLAQVQSQVTVTVAPSPLDVSQTSVTTIIDHERIEELPVRTRNALNFVLLAPGVSPTRSESSAGPQSASSSSGFSFSGLRSRSNNISIDGLDNNDEFTGASRTELSPEIVSEFQIVNNGISAEFGGASGGSVNVVTRSGANEIHGDAFIFAQNGALDARPAVENESLKPDLRRYRIGLANGGAIKKNETFYYLAFEQEYQRGQEDSILSPAVTGSLNAYFARGADPRHPTRLLNPDFFPRARGETEASERLDQKLGNSNSLMLRYAFTNNREASEAFNAGGLNDPSAAGSSFIRDNAFAGSSLTTISPSSVNDVRFQLAQRKAVLRTNDAAGPEIQIAGLIDFGSPYYGNDRRTENHYEGSDTLSWNRRRQMNSPGSAKLDLVICSQCGEPAHPAFQSS